jgi:ketosteroid isomerase-like protein
VSLDEAKMRVYVALEQVGLAPDADPAEVTEELIRELASSLEDVIDPDVECAMVGGEGGLTGTFHGVEGFIDAWSDWLAAFETVTFTVEEPIDTPDGFVGLARQRGKSKHGGVEIENRSGSVWRFRDDRLARVEFHLDPAAALRSGGLDPQSGQE